MLPVIQAEPHFQRFTVARPPIQLQRIPAQDLHGAGFRGVVIHRNLRVMLNIEPHPLQQLAVVPRAGAQCDDGGKGEQAECPP